MMQSSKAVQFGCIASMKSSTAQINAVRETSMVDRATAEAVCVTVTPDQLKNAIENMLAMHPNCTAFDDCIMYRASVELSMFICCSEKRMNTPRIVPKSPSSPTICNGGTLYWPKNFSSTTNMVA